MQWGTDIHEIQKLFKIEHRPDLCSFHPVTHVFTQQQIVQRICADEIKQLQTTHSLYSTTTKIFF